MPKARIAALNALANAVAADPKLIEPAGSYGETIAKLLALPRLRPLDRAILGAARLARQRRLPRRRRRAAAQSARRREGPPPDAEGVAGARGILAAVARLCRPSICGPPMPNRSDIFYLDRVETPIGEVLLVADGQGTLRMLEFRDKPERWRPDFARRFGETDFIETRDPSGLSSALARYFRRRARCAGQNKDGRCRHRIPALRLDAAAQNPRRHDHDLWRACRQARRAESDARGRPCKRRKPDRHCRALSSCRGQRWFADRDMAAA